MRIVGTVILWSLALWAPAKAQPMPVEFKLTPELRGQTLQALDVEIRLRADRTGKTVIDLPDGGTGHKERWRYISDLSANGADVEFDTPAKRVLRSKPFAPITLRYRVTSAYDSDPRGEDGNPYAGPAIRPAWFTSLGNYVFLTPEGRDNDPADFRWGSLPKLWTVASSLDPIRGKASLTVADVVNSTMLGGEDVKIYERPIKGGALRVAMRGAWRFPSARLVDDIAAIISAQRNFWSSLGGTYFVSVTQLATTPTNISVGGTGKFHSFALYATSNAGEPMMRRTVAHEHTHNWIPLAQGRMAEGSRERGDYWYSEGFADFYTDRSLLRSGLWTLQDFVQHMNEMLRAYDTSPVRTAPNTRIIADFWNDPSVDQLPYQRGYLLAFLWDRRLRAATHGRAGLDQVMFLMRDRYKAAPEKAKPELVPSFKRAVTDTTGVNLGPDIERFALHGEPIIVPPDLFGRCAMVASITKPEFDLGFDLTAAQASGAFQGVDPKGPAYRAGLRDGMKRLGFSGGEVGNSQVAITYRVQDESGVAREITYRPEGAKSSTFQQVALSPSASGSDAAACRALMSGESAF